MILALVSREKNSKNVVEHKYILIVMESKELLMKQYYALIAVFFATHFCTVSSAISDGLSTAVADVLPVVPSPPEPKQYAHNEDGKKEVKLRYVGPLTGYSVDAALGSLEPFLISRSVEKAVEQFIHLPKEKALEILTQLINNNKMNFSKQRKSKELEIRRNDFLQIIFGVAHFYPSEKDRYSFFDLMSFPQGLGSGIRPALFVASISSYPMIIPDLLSWLSQKNDKEEHLLDAARYGIDRNSSRSMHAFCSYAGKEIKPLLGQLLFYAVQKNKSKKLVAALLACGADVNYSDASGYTPLIKAVELENFENTKLLVEHGANLDHIAKDDVGSAWQKSGEIGNTAIIKYISDHHATKPKVSF